MSAVFELVLLAVLEILTDGDFPDRKTGPVVAVGTCVAGAVILHFVAP